MIIRQLCVGKMVVFTYVIQDPETGDCALIDPAFEVQKILATVKEMEGRVTHVINTHGHADHVCGNADAIEATGAKLGIHEAEASMLKSWLTRPFAYFVGGRPSPKPDILLKDNDVLEIGGTSLKIIHTPGHSPGGMCLLGDGNLITGDTLFVGCIGATWFPKASLGLLQRSIRERLLTLPPETRVYPGHNYGVRPVSTIGAEIAENPYV